MVLRTSQSSALFAAFFSFTLLACGSSDDGARRRPAPVVASVSPAAAAPGETVVLKGTHLGADGGEILVGETSAKIASWTDEQAEFEVPEVDPGSHPVRVIIGKFDLTGPELAVVDKRPSVTAVSIGGAPFIRGAVLTAEAGVSGEAEKLAYQWKVNGADVAGATQESFAGPFVRGNRVSCAVTAENTHGKSEAVTSPEVVIGNSAPSATAVAIGGTARAGGTLSANASGWSDADGDAPGYVYAWIVNGVESPGGPSLAGGFAKGDEVRVRAVPFDGITSGAAVTSAPVTITDTPPAVVSAAIAPGVYRAADTLASTVSAGDADGEAVTYSYRWFVNGAPIGATGASLSNAFAKDDEVAVEVTPHAASVAGTPVLSAAVSIVNTAPTVSTPALSAGPYLAGVDITASASGADADAADSATVTYAWFVNGTQVATGASLSGASIAKGDQVYVRATANDGAATASADSVKVTVGNRAPVISNVQLSSASYRAGDAPSVTATVTDADASDTPAVTYTWYVNGTAKTVGAALDAVLFRKGDEIFARVSATDGVATATADSAAVTIGDTAPAVVSVSLGAGPFSVSSTLSAAASAGDADGEAVTYSYRWFVNGAPMGATGASFSGAFAKGDAVAVEVTPHAATVAGTPVLSAAMSIVNTAPTVSTPALSAGPYLAGVDITASASGADADAADSATVTYAWFVNGTQVATGTSLSGATLAKGDQVYVRATANDGAATASADSATVTVGNHAPVISNVLLSNASYQVGDAPSVAATVTDADASDAPVVTYTWYVNGAAKAVGAVLASALVQKNDQVFARVSANDGATTVEADSATVILGDTAPAVTSLSLGAGPFDVTSTLAPAAAASDADGEAVTYSYRWFVNGALVGATGASLAGSFAKGDTVAVEVTPHAAAVAGAPALSAAVSIGNAPPEPGPVQLSSGPYVEGTTITATATATDPDAADAPTVSYAWFVNGAQVATGNTLSSASFAKGNQVFVRATADDGTVTRSVDSAAVSIADAAPVLASVSIGAGPYFAVDTLAASAAASDADGEAVTFTYRWFVNGADTGETGLTLWGAFVRDDVVAVEVTPWAGGGAGVPMLSADVTIQNSVPTVSGVQLSAPPHLEGATLSVSATAGDADLDDIASLSYAWFVNGAQVATTPTLSGAFFAKGDTVKVRATADDGTAAAWAESPDVTIGNTPPTLGAAFISLGVEAGTGLPQVSVGGSMGLADADAADSLSLRYAWYVNGSIVPGQAGDRLTASNFSQGDQVYALVIPFDGTVEGTGVQTNTVMAPGADPSFGAAVISPEGNLYAASNLTALGVGYFDLDGTPLVSQDTRWYVNGVFVASTATLAGPFTPGVTVAAAVRPYDGATYGAWVLSPVRTILTSPPAIAAVYLDGASRVETSTLSPVITGAADPDGDPVTFTYKWYVNGSPIAPTTATLTGADFSKGDAVAVEVTPRDPGGPGAPILSNTIAIQNSAPSVASAALTPATIRTNDTATVTPAGWSDADGDGPGYTYEWSVNGVVAVGQTASTLAGTNFAVGDVVVARVTPTDGALSGAPVVTAAKIVANSLPALTSAAIFGGPYATNSVITATPIGWSDADGGAAQYQYQWYVNGAPVAGQIGASINGAAYFSKGDFVFARIWPFDGKDVGAALNSNAVVIANSAPQLTAIYIQGDTFRTDDSLFAAVTAVDADGDAVMFSYDWSVNGVLLGWNDAVLPGSFFAKGDSIVAWATPFDGVAAGSAVSSVPLAIQNTPPVLSAVTLSAPPYNKTGAIDAYPGSAFDADGDAVSYTYAWRVNGVVAGTASSLAPANFSRGQTVQAFITPADVQTAGAAVASPVVTVTNTPPGMPALTLNPAVMTAASPLWVVPTAPSDADGDAVFTYKYAWYRNGRSLGFAENVTALSNNVVREGGVITVVARANDGYADGPTNSATRAMAPRIQSLSGTINITLGAAVFVYGAGFGDTQGASSVTVNGTTASIDSWSENVIAIRVPNVGIQAAAPVVVNVAGLASNAVNISTVAQIGYVSPVSGPVGTKISVSGRGFGATQGTRTLLVGTQAATVTSWSDTLIVATVAGTLTNNTTYNVALGAGTVSNSFPFRVFNGITYPSVTNIVPAQAAPGVLVALSGTNLTFGAETPRVFFSGVTATVTAFSATSISCIVPAHAASGFVNVSVRAGGRDSNAVTFEHQRPMVASVSPAQATGGTVVTVLGAYLGGATGTLKLGARTPAATSWTNTQVVFTVPGNAYQGAQPVTLTTFTGFAAQPRDLWVSPGDRWILPEVTGRSFQVTAWTGSEMLIWGGRLPANRNGARFNPVTGEWYPMATAGAPSNSLAYNAEAVWTGQRLLVWGGPEAGNAGLYDPATDTWAAVSTTNAPISRSGYTLVWAEDRAIVWGGYDGAADAVLGDGASYNPKTNTWTAIPVTSSVSPRTGHVAVWTGNEMIVWGGQNAADLNTGALYHPATGRWRVMTTTASPGARSYAAGHWTGSQMIIYGGQTLGAGYYNDAYSYTPATNVWLYLGGVPIRGRVAAFTAWTGSKLIVFGGYGYRNVNGIERGSLADAATWELGSGWRVLDVPGDAVDAYAGSAVWTGTEFIAWGGFDSDAAQDVTQTLRYNPTSGAWASDHASQMRPIENPAYYYTLTWTGAEVLAWASNVRQVYRYDPATDQWRASSLVDPIQSNNGIAAWTGSELITYNPYAGQNRAYNPATDSWRDLSPAPDRTRYANAATYSATELFTWGGYNAGVLSNLGYVYRYATDTWQPVSTVNAPTARMHASTTYLDGKVYVFGGNNGATHYAQLYVYDPANDTWQRLADAPQTRSRHAAFAYGGKLHVWGGQPAANSNGVVTYDPGTNTWTTGSTTGAPANREAFAWAVGNGRLMLWGGGRGCTLQTSGGYSCGAPYFSDGGVYDLAAGTWSPMAPGPSPAAYSINGVWAGDRMMIVGGRSSVAGAALGWVGTYLP